MQQVSRHCKICERQTLHVKHSTVGCGWGLLLSLLTVGLFIPIWFALGIRDAFTPFRCQQCGKGRLT